LVREGIQDEDLREAVEHMSIMAEEGEEI